MAEENLTVPTEYFSSVDSFGFSTPIPGDGRVLSPTPTMVSSYGVTAYAGNELETDGHSPLTEVTYPPWMNTSEFHSNSTWDYAAESNLTEVRFERNEELAKMEIAIQSLILFLAIFGNGIVLVVLLGLRRKKLSRMNIMIVHLSCADLFVAFFNVLPQLIWDITYRFHGGNSLCKLVKYLQIVAMYASSYVLVSTAIDRYLAICHPLTTHTWTTRKIHFLVGAAWFFSLLFSFPQLIIFSYVEVKEGSGVYDCWGTFNPEWTLQLYVTWFTLAVYVIPFILLAVAYGKICYVVWRSMKAKEMPKSSKKFTSPMSADRDKVENGNLLTVPGGGKKGGRKAGSNPRAHVKGMSQAKVKTVKLTLTVIVCYLLCWGPWFVSQMWAAWDPEAPFQGRVCEAVYVVKLCHQDSNGTWEGYMYKYERDILGVDLN